MRDCERESIRVFCHLDSRAQGKGRYFHKRQKDGRQKRQKQRKELERIGIIWKTDYKTGGH